MEWTTLHENLIDPLFVFNTEKGITKYNLAFMLYFDLTPRELRKIKKIEDFILTPSVNVFEGEKTTSYQNLEFFTPKGKKLSVLMLFEDLPDQSILVHMKDAAIEISLQEKYGQQILELERLNKDQEKIIEERTQDLRESYELMKRVLKSLKGEVYVLDDSGNVKAGFGPSVSGQVSGDFGSNAKVTEKDNEYFKDWFKSYVMLEDQRDILITLAPEKFKSDNKTLRPDFYQIPSSTQFEMAVIMNDITEEEALRVKSLRADELASAIHKALLNKNSFPLFLTSFNNLKGKYLGDTSAVDLVTYKRDLHTLKGLLSQYGHSNASGDIHLLEEEAALDQAGGIVKLNELLNSSEETINKVITLVGESLLLPQNSGFDTGGIAEFFRTTLNDSLKALGKSPSIFNLELRANPVLTSDEVDKLMVATLHYARNVAAHASEAGETRVSKGKDEKIRIQFIVNKNGSSIEFIINDDGKGTTKQNDIFEQKSSETSQNADLYSGRGLGMATIKEALNKLGGDATFKSVVEVGSTLSLTFNKS
jgi:hypothetical protein